jgi:hypothetical protein
MRLMMYDLHTLQARSWALAFVAFACFFGS